MNLPWGDERTKQFITNVGLVTSSGPSGDNIMACEWTHQISYTPGLIAICIWSKGATYTNISKTKQFGINICSTTQSIMSSVAGGYSGSAVDKIKALQELGFKFYKGNKIDALMVKDAVVNIECTLFKKIVLGSHTMFVGEAVAASVNSNQQPLAYHNGGYWKVTEQIKKPSDAERDRIKKIVDKHQK